MRLRSAMAVFGVAAVVALPVLAQQAIPLEERAAKARETTQLFSDRLKGEIAAALKSGGAIPAIAMCHSLAPDLNNTVGDKSGFEVRRTALRVRNPENAPDAWEAGILEHFAKKLSAGADISRLEHYETVKTEDGDKLFRYMKAIPTGEPCLVCHGTDVRPDVKAEIARYYPEDKATGFRLGDLRGAFSLVQLIEE